MAPTPITIVTGFLGSGKTTIILNLIPQLPSTYRLALLKNEFGDVAIDSQIAASRAIAGVRELLNGCICCNLVGQLGDALETLRRDVDPDRIIIETSGSAFPATLAMEVNRLARDTNGTKYVLDGVVVVIDVENWRGYEDTSYTAKLQAKYTDLVILNKWEDAGERRLDDCLDRLGDLDVDVPFVKSDRGLVSKDALLGFDRSLAGHFGTPDADGLNGTQSGGDDHHHGESEQEEHTREVDVLSVTLSTSQKDAVVNVGRLEELLGVASKDEVYRIKAILLTDHVPSSNDPVHHQRQQQQNDEIQDVGPTTCILNWAFGRWTFFTAPNSQISSQAAQPSSSSSSSSSVPTTSAVAAPVSASPSQPDTTILRMTVVLARNEGSKWQKRIQQNGWIQTHGQDDAAVLTVNIK